MYLTAIAILQTQVLFVPPSAPHLSLLTGIDGFALTTYLPN